MDELGSIFGTGCIASVSVAAENCSFGINRDLLSDCHFICKHLFTVMFNGAQRLSSFLKIQKLWVQISLDTGFCSLLVPSSELLALIPQDVGFFFTSISISSAVYSPKDAIVMISS